MTDTDAKSLAATAGRILETCQLLVDELPLTHRPSFEELRRVIVPLLTWCRRRRPQTARGLVGIVGPPGSGKSTLMAWLAGTAKALEFGEFAFMALDGYHLPNDVLGQRKVLDPDGNVLSLRELKGTPASFDAERLLSDLRTIRSSRDVFYAPAYSRSLHEPVAKAIRIGPEVDWVFVDGNHLYLDEPPWRDIREVLDRKVYLRVEEDALRRRLAARHSAADRDADWIEAHFRRTDGPNIKRVQSSARFADLVLTWDADAGFAPLA